MKNINDKQTLIIAEEEAIKKIKNILKSHKDPYKKKVALFELIKNLEVGDMEPEKKKRTNWLLQGHLYNELAKQCMDEYKKTTVEAFSKNDKEVLWKS